MAYFIYLALTFAIIGAPLNPDLMGKGASAQVINYVSSGKRGGLRRG